MARIRAARPKNVSGSYERLFGDAEIGALASKIQSAVIAAGNELQRMITDRVDVIDDLDAFLETEIMPEGVLLAQKSQIKKSTTLEFPGSEPDFMVFKRRKGVQKCHIVELKDGHVFDTKKASAERRAMHAFIEHNAPHIPYRFESHFCAFNQDERSAIWEGFKKKISLREAMTGREFCKLLEIDYDEIVTSRKNDCDDNVEFFLSEIVKMKHLHAKLIAKLLNEHS